jgi:cysteine desulfurase/selenocysteine lyase
MVQPGVVAASRPRSSAVPLDVHRIRADFPILSSTARSGRPLVNHDKAATSQKPRQEIDPISRFNTRENPNNQRGRH